MTLLTIIFVLNQALLALDHLYTGSLAMFFPKRAIRAYTKIFGVEIPETKECLVMLRPWGALGIFAGLVGLLPIFDPQRYALVLWALIILLIMRIIYRLRFQKEATISMKVSRQRNLFHIGLICICASLILAQLIYLK